MNLQQMQLLNGENPEEGPKNHANDYQDHQQHGQESHNQHDENISQNDNGTGMDIDQSPTDVHASEAEGDEDRNHNEDVRDHGDCSNNAKHEKFPTVCLIKNVTDKQVSPVRFSVDASTTCKDLMDLVGKKLKYCPNSFALHYERSSNSLGEQAAFLVHENLEKNLSDFCENIGNDKNNIFIVLPLDDKKFESTNSDVDMYESAGKFMDNAEKSVSFEVEPKTSYSFALTHEQEFVGLVNQAMTCYLNSLLQTLYMTPEFRNAVYRWQAPVNVDASRSIPLQLQRLFVLLQTCKKRAIETKDITLSFGWDSSEAWQQHDVQELCRVMFDALEKTWKNTDQADLINQLYQGKLKDYVKCLNCEQESARVDSFLDIPLAIRPFGSTKIHSTVEEALHGFTKPEILHGNNQYFCGKCNKKCDAHKGLKFVSFPYLLTLQLLRFDFDYNSLHRVKLNDRLTFPDILTLDDFIDDSTSESENDKMETENEEVEPENGGDGDREQPGTNKKKQSLQYELFSIMVHSGSAAGGHYYVYIKSFSDKLWRSFNDQHVSRIDQDAIRRTYGGNTYSGNRPSYTSTYASSTNAYMLMYRKIDTERNDEFLSVDQFPHHLKDMLSSIDNEERDQVKRRELERNSCKIKVYCSHPNRSQNVEITLEIHMNTSLRKATEICWQRFDLTNVVPLDCVRLVCYNENSDWIENSYDGMENCAISKVLGGVQKVYNFDLLLQIKSPDQVFQVFKPGGISIFVYVVDITASTITPLNNMPIRANLSQRVNELRHQLGLMLGTPLNDIRIIRERYPHQLSCGRPEMTLSEESFLRKNKIFVEAFDVDDRRTLFTESKLYQLIDNFLHAISLPVTLPSLSSKPDKNLQPIELGSDDDEDDSEEVGDNDNFNGIKEVAYAFKNGALDPTVAEVHSKYASKINFELNKSTETLQFLRKRYLTEKVDPYNDPVVSLFFKFAPSESSALAMMKQLPLVIQKSFVLEAFELFPLTVAIMSASMDVNHRRCVFADFASDTRTRLDRIVPKMSSSDEAALNDRVPMKKVRIPGKPSGQEANGSTAVESPNSSTAAGSSNSSTAAGSPSTTVTGSPDSTVAESHNRMAAESPNSSTAGSPNSTVAGSPNSTVAGSPNSTVAGSPNSTVAGSPNSTTAGSPNSTAAGSPNSTPAGSPNSTPAGSPNSTPAGSPNSTAAGSPIDRADVVSDLSGDEQLLVPLGCEEQEQLSKIADHAQKANIPIPPVPPKLTPKEKTPQHLNTVSGHHKDNWDEDASKYASSFKYESTTDSHGAQVLSVTIDKRITFGGFKKLLEPIVQTDMLNFKLFRQTGQYSDTECRRLSDSLVTYNDDIKLSVQYGRALRPGESRCSIHLLDLNDTESFSKQLFEMIVPSEVNVWKLKKLICLHAKQLTQLQMSVDRLRVRKKVGLTPGDILKNSDIVEEMIAGNMTAYIQMLKGPDILHNQRFIFIRRWNPTTFEVYPKLDEIVLQDKSINCLLNAICIASDIPYEQIAIAVTKTVFPCSLMPWEIRDLSIISTDHPHQSINSWPLNISGDGHVVLYKNNMDIQGDFQQLIPQMEKKYGTIWPSSPKTTLERPTGIGMSSSSMSNRKEKALKIYTDSNN